MRKNSGVFSPDTFTKFHFNKLFIIQSRDSELFQLQLKCFTGNSLCTCSVNMLQPWVMCMPTQGQCGDIMETEEPCWSSCRLQRARVEENRRPASGRGNGGRRPPVELVSPCLHPTFTSSVCSRRPSPWRWRRLGGCRLPAGGRINRHRMARHLLLARHQLLLKHD